MSSRAFGQTEVRRAALLSMGQLRGGAGLRFGAPPGCLLCVLCVLCGSSLCAAGGLLSLTPSVYGTGTVGDSEGESTRHARCKGYEELL